MTENDGFSVVAATSTTWRFSTPGSRASCWALVNRWISSRKSTVWRPYMSRARLACSITARTSLTPAVTADSSTNSRSAAVATRWARVVLPVPGGPQRMAEIGPAAPPLPSMSRRSGLPGRSTSPWPRTSSMPRGRIRTASGGSDAPPPTPSPAEAAAPNRSVSSRLTLARLSRENDAPGCRVSRPDPERG